MCPAVPIPSKDRGRRPIHSEALSVFTDWLPLGRPPCPRNAVRTFASARFRSLPGSASRLSRYRNTTAISAAPSCRAQRMPGQPLPMVQTASSSHAKPAQWRGVSSGAAQSSPTQQPLRQRIRRPPPIRRRCPKLPLLALLVRSRRAGAAHGDLLRAHLSPEVPDSAGRNSPVHGQNRCTSRPGRREPTSEEGRPRPPGRRWRNTAASCSRWFCSRGGQAVLKQHQQKEQEGNRDEDQVIELLPGSPTDAGVSVARRTVCRPEARSVLTDWT